MLKLLRRFGRQFLPLFFIAVLLLIARAALELSLPNLMSDIVDVGIAQGGIDYDVPIPKELTAASFKNLSEPNFYTFNPATGTYFLSDEALSNESNQNPETKNQLISALAALQHSSTDNDPKTQTQ